jgi:hypothetical protein
MVSYQVGRSTANLSRQVRLKLATADLRDRELRTHQRSTPNFLPPEAAMSIEWKIYRTRFLVRAKQLTEPMMFVDLLGREHCGRVGDYLVESSDGMQRIASREIFEDIYVAMGSIADDGSLPTTRSNFALQTPTSSVAARIIVS